jgi:tRNA-splicing endonuclease subunit Sen15, fungi type
MTHLATMKPAVLSSPLQSLVADPALLSSSTHLPSLHTLAIQIQHNLQYQHSWTDLRIHTRSPLTNELLPRPLLSGLPPTRLYIHPDEQIELLKKADQERKANREAGGDTEGLEVKAEPEREWVLPTRVSEKWTLRRISSVFDAVSLVPPEPEAENTAKDRPVNPWRTTKRVVLATVDPDSTVVFYILHDGVVKPRQN